jgi:uncharacterized membrane protein
MSCTTIPNQKYNIYSMLNKKIKRHSTYNRMSFLNLKIYLIILLLSRYQLGIVADLSNHELDN